MEFRRYLHILRRRAVFVVATVIVAVTIAWITTPRDADYVATSTIYVGTNQFEGFESSELSADRFAALDRLLLTYSSMIRSRSIAQDAVDTLGLPMSAPSVVGRTQVGPQGRTQLLQIAVTDADPALARDLANAMADAFVERVRVFDGTTATQGQEGDLPGGLPAFVFERSVLPVQPQEIGLLRNLVLAGLFALLAAASLVFAVEYLDVTIKTPTDAERRLDLPVLGAIPQVRNQNLLGLVRRVTAAEAPDEVDEIAERARA
jgi:capsular polysaccharide biosynthesis protein